MPVSIKASNHKACLIGKCCYLTDFYNGQLTNKRQNRANSVGKDMLRVVHNVFEVHKDDLVILHC